MGKKLVLFVTKAAGENINQPRTFLFVGLVIMNWPGRVL